MNFQKEKEQEQIEHHENKLNWDASSLNHIESEIEKLRREIAALKLSQKEYREPSPLEKKMMTLTDINVTLMEISVNITKLDTKVTDNFEAVNSRLSILELKTLGIETRLSYLRNK